MFTDDGLTDTSGSDSHSLEGGLDTSTDDGQGSISGEIDQHLGLDHDVSAHDAFSGEEIGEPSYGADDHPADDRQDGDVSAAQSPSADQPADGDLTLSGSAGTIDLGAPNLSYDGGEPNAVAVESPDGSVEAYLDADHNGTVDQVVRIEPDGSFAVWSSDGESWSVLATGHLDAGGNAVLDPSIDPQVAATEPSALSQAGVSESATPESATPGTTTPETNAPGTPAGDHTDSTNPPVATESTEPAPVDPADPQPADQSAPTDDQSTGDQSADDQSADGQSAGDDTYPGVESGDIAVATGGDHYVDAGPAQYDLNGDGTPETAVLHDGDRIIQVSDTDGDGRADEMLQVDTDTHQAAILTDDGTGNWQVSATGYVDHSGDFVTADDGSGQSGTVDVTNDQSAPDIMVGSTDVGAPNQDLDGDGVAESVAVRTDDGAILVVSDVDGDGTADQIIAVDPESGDAVWAVPDGHGGWEQAATGHVGSDGQLVVDSRDTGGAPGFADAEGVQHAPFTVSSPMVADHAESVTPVAFSYSNAVTAMSGSGEAIAGQDVTIDPNTAAEPTEPTQPTEAVAQPTEPATDEPGAAVGQATATIEPAPDSPTGADSNSVIVDIDGREFDAGAPTVDSDGDGRPDTVEVPGPNDTTLHYQDSNGDGIADKAWTTDASGQVTASYQLGASGQWADTDPAAASTGPADTNGQAVDDQSV